MKLGIREKKKEGEASAVGKCFNKTVCAWFMAENILVLKCRQLGSAAIISIARSSISLAASMCSRPS